MPSPEKNEPSVEHAAIYSILLGLYAHEARINKWRTKLPRLAAACSVTIPEFVKAIKQLKHLQVLTIESDKHMVFSGGWEAFEKWGFTTEEINRMKAVGNKHET